MKPKWFCELPRKKRMVLFEAALLHAPGETLIPPGVLEVSIMDESDGEHKALTFGTVEVKMLEMTCRFMMASQYWTSKYSPQGLEMSSSMQRRLGK